MNVNDTWAGDDDDEEDDDDDDDDDGDDNGDGDLYSGRFSVSVIQLWRQCWFAWDFNIPWHS